MLPSLFLEKKIVRLFQYFHTNFLVSKQKDEEGNLIIQLPFLLFISTIYSIQIIRNFIPSLSRISNQIHFNDTNRLIKRTILQLN